jgi:hypothetical protein
MAKQEATLPISCNIYPKLIKSFRHQHMHYILISKSITPTYVSAYNKPSSGVKVLHMLYIIWFNF